MELYVLPRLGGPNSYADRDDDEAVRHSCEVLTSSIASFRDPDRVKAFAEDLGRVARTRKHLPGLTTLAAIPPALCHGPDTEGCWLDAQSLYQQLGGRRAGATAFRHRLRDLEPVFRELLLRRRVLSLPANTQPARRRRRRPQRTTATKADSRRTLTKTAFSNSSRPVRFYCVQAAAHGIVSRRSQVWLGTTLRPDVGRKESAVSNNDDELMGDGELSLADLEGSMNPVLERVKDRLLGERSAEPSRAGHTSHSSSSGRGHSSHVSGRFEDDATSTK